MANKYNDCKCGGKKKTSSKVCQKCTGRVVVEDQTYKYYKDKYNNWWTSRLPIAKDARNKYANSNQPRECFNCGYKHHIDICHIKAVSEFDENTLIKEINNINNLVALCPNCHWEFDNGLLIINK